MKKTSFILFLAFIIGALPLANLQAAGEIRSIVFPVIGSVSYYDDFGAARVGHTHEGNDLMGRKMMPLVAAVDGVVRWTQYPQPDWGYAISLSDADGYQYWYLHVNNDNKGSDDGQGGGILAYAPDVINGAKVLKGQLIGWMGDSGNAEGTMAHLHFEIHSPDGTPYSPFASLQAATKITTPVDAPKQSYEMLPFENFKGGATVAAGRFGGTASIVTAAGPGGGPHLKVMTSEGVVTSQFFPYPMSFKGGVDVAVGDIDGNGIDEIITGAGPGGGPHVRIFDSNGNPRGSFMAYPTSFRGGVRVSAGDVDNDGKAEIITGAGPGGGPQVRVFKADGTPIASFMAYALTFRGGVDVALKASTQNSASRIITSPLSQGGPHIRSFDVLGNVDASFFAYPEDFKGGVKVSVITSTDLFSPYTIVAVPASKGGPDIRLFTPTGSFIRSEKAFEPWWRGGYEVATTSNGNIYLTADGRRASIRTTGQSYYSNNNGNNNTNNNNWGRWWGRGD